MLRGLRLRCPVCGQGRLFDGWWKTRTHCTECGVPFAREPGFYLGAIYISYGLTAVVASALYLGLRFGAGNERAAFWASIGWTLFFPLLFFRHARSLWLAFDELCDPRTKN